MYITRITYKGGERVEETKPKWLSEAHIREEDGRWIFDGKVMRLEGVGRFVMGLLDQVEILEGEELWDYMQAQCRMGMGKKRPVRRPL